MLKIHSGNFGYLTKVLEENKTKMCVQFPVSVSKILLSLTSAGPNKVNHLRGVGKRFGKGDSLYSSRKY